MRDVPKPVQDLFCVKVIPKRYRRKFLSVKALAVRYAERLIAPALFIRRKIMELRHLKYFITVAEELNFRKAAERLHIEQPPLSRQIHQLEEELGVSLFARNKRGVALTEAGEAFLGEARLTIAQADRTARVAQQFNGTQPKRLTIGYLICAFDRLLSQIIQAFRTSSPDVEIVLKGMHTVPQIEALFAGEIDVGFVYFPVNQPELLTQLVLREPLVLILPGDHPLAALPTIPLASLADEPMLIYPRFVRPDLYDLIITLCYEAGFQAQIVQEATPRELLASLVEAGVGLALVEGSDESRHNPGVVYRPIAESTPYLDMGAVWHKNRSSAIVNQFISVVKQSINFDDQRQGSARSDN
jgi:DNA-binding transcriptional LysR family regulator